MTEYENIGNGMERLDKCLTKEGGLVLPSPLRSMAFPIYSTYPIDHGSDSSWLPFPPNSSTNEARMMFASLQVENNLENDAMRDYGVNGIESKTANRTRKKEKSKKREREANQQGSNLEVDRSETTTKPPKWNSASTGA